MWCQTTMSSPAQVASWNNGVRIELFEMLREGTDYLDSTRPGNGPLARRRVCPGERQIFGDRTTMLHRVRKAGEVHQYVSRDLEVEAKAASLCEICLRQRHHRVSRVDVNG